MKSRTKNWTIAAMLWTAQALLAGLFIFAGGVKLSFPTETLAAQTQMLGRRYEFRARCRHHAAGDWRGCRVRGVRTLVPGARGRSGIDTAACRATA